MMTKKATTPMLHCCAAFLMALGPGTAGGFYTGMSGFYIQQFRDPSFFVTMLLCFGVTAPIVSLLQQRFDGHFDEAFSTRVTFSFRVISMQLILGTLVVMWMFCTTKMSVLLIGCLLGFCVWTIMSSSLQMIAATEPTHIIYAHLGLQMGGLLPIIIFPLSGFNPSSSFQEFQWNVSTVVFVSVLAACLLGHFDRTSQIFAKAYERLSYDQTPRGKNVGEEQGLLAENSELGASLDPEAAKHGVPSWVPYWQVCGGLSMAINCALVSLAGYFGDASMAQSLALLKMLMEFIGRLGVWAVPFLDAFTKGPWHNIMAGGMIAVVCLFALCLTHLSGVHLGHELFLVFWCSLFALSVFSLFAGGRDSWILCECR